MEDNISVHDALIICNDMNYKVTKMGLIYIGKKNGWIKKVGLHLFVRKECLIEYIKMINEVPAKGWVPIASLVHLAKNPGVFYYTLNKYDIAIKWYGRGRIRYAEENIIRKIFANN